VPAWLKLLTGVAATGLATNGWYMFERQALLARLGAETIPVFTAHHVGDARIDWRSDNGWTFRTARIAGTASAAERAAITREIAALPGIHAAVWRAE
jgi:hypothetical protein